MNILQVAGGIAIALIMGRYFLQEGIRTWRILRDEWRGDRRDGDGSIE